MHSHHQHNYYLVTLSLIIAMFASYTALDLVSSLSASKGRVKWLWLLGGSLAMGVGIWSMHFIGMLAFSIPGLAIYYDVPLLLLSILVAIVASALALYVIADRKPTVVTYCVGSFVMGSAIAGMHYIGIASMIMAAVIHWDYFYVALSIMIAMGASYAALFTAFKLRDDITIRGFAYRGLGGIMMGFAIAGMHYTAMAAMDFTLAGDIENTNSVLLATDGLAASVIIGTIIILALALTGSNIDRALSRKTVVNSLLQEGIQARDKFLSIASHELKTPLTSLKLQIQIIQRIMDSDDLVDRAKAKSMLRKTDQSLDRIDNLVNDMLDISRITSGKLSLQKNSTDLMDVVLEIIERFGPQFDQLGPDSIRFSGSSVKGNFDGYRLEQVFSNLLSNALKYGKGQPVDVSLCQVDDRAQIIIHDHGFGIPESDHEKIFKRFERLAATSEVSGLGLGLFIVKEIVEAHSGSIRVESHSGAGTSFIVEIPMFS